MKNYILEAFFNLYLFISKYDNTESYRNSVYDSLGVIDTMGNHGDRGRFTWSYSDEFVSVFAIRLLFGYDLQYINDCSNKSIHLCKGQWRKTLVVS